jgi:hypothetical protein
VLTRSFAADLVQKEVSQLADKKPQALQIVLGDSNRCPLQKELPTFTQYVSCPTRYDQILDNFYCNAKNAYRSQQGHPLSNSDHYMIYMQPTYATKLLRNKPTTICQRIYSRENLLQLNDCFELTDWNIFTDNSVDLDILMETVTGYINFCTDLVIPSKQIKIYGNNNPWMTSALKKLLIEKTNWQKLINCVGG